jgi:hypothetical protein
VELAGADEHEHAAEIAREAGVFDDDADVAVTDDGISVTAERVREHGTDLLVALRDEATIIGANILQFPLLFVSTAFLPLEFLPGWIQTIARFNPVTYGARALMPGEDVMTVVEVTRFSGVWDTLVPAIAVLSVLDVLLGGLMVYLLNRASSATVR